MTKRSDAWYERQKRAAERRAVMRIDRCTIEPVKGEKAQEGQERYLVTIDGFHLHPAISPPRVTVGEEVVEELSFGKDGRQIRGVLRRRPDGERVRVDYGFAHAETRLSNPRPPEDADG